MPGRTIRLAVWCAPRTVSTALMRAWGNRADTAVCDEPLYAPYLRETGLPHPGAAEVIAAGPADWRDAVAFLTGPVPGGRRIFFQKHMAKHLLPSVDRDWLEGMDHAFLIRDPRESLLSLRKVIPDPTLHDTGLEEQEELFSWLQDHTGHTPAVLDSVDLLRDPRGVLSLWCDRLGVPFDEAMLSWPAGPRATDGVWARHWYGNVERSTGFLRPAERAGRSHPLPSAVPAGLLGVLERCRASYDHLARHRILPDAPRPPETPRPARDPRPPR